jgi:hypothetical protein
MHLGWLHAFADASCRRVIAAPRDGNGHRGMTNWGQRLRRGYLIVYYLLIVAAAATVWRSRLVDHLPWTWSAALVIGAIVVGALFGWASRR